MKSCIGVKHVRYASPEKRDFFVVDSIAALGLHEALSSKSAEQVAELEWLQSNGAIFEVDDDKVVTFAAESAWASSVLVLAAQLLEKMEQDVAPEWLRLQDAGRRGLYEDLLRAAAAYIAKHNEILSIPLLHSPHFSTFAEWRKNIQVLCRVFDAIPDTFGMQVVLPTGPTISDKDILAEVKAILQKLAGVSSITPSSAVEIVLSKFPTPADTIPWEQVLDFVKDEAVLTHRLELRRWMRKVATQELAGAEIREEIEYLQAKYLDFMRLHKLKTQPGHLQSLISVPAEIVQNLVRMKFGDVAKSLFSFRERSVALLEAESNAPGCEIAYIIKARAEFG